MNITVINTLWFLNTVAAFLLVGRLVAEGLAPKYLFLVIYFLIDGVQQVAGLSVTSLLSPKAAAFPYFWIYSIGQATKLVLSILIVLELCLFALEEHPALARYARSMAARVLAGIAVIV